MTAAQVADRVNRAWPLWQESQAALDQATEWMQKLAQWAAEDSSPGEMDPNDVRAMHKALSRFQEKFNLMVREQKRRAVR